jgi:Tol biopolymer transport system component
MPVPSKDGKRIYVVGGQERPELLKYDSKSGQFLPYLSGVASTAVRFSRDGQWIAHRVALDGALWRSKIDGSQRLQLTFPPVQVFQWQWSPDGKQIAFTATEPGRPMKLYLVSAQGENPRQLLPEGRNEMEVDWSPDGDALVFDRWPLGWPNVPIGSFTPESLHILDLKTSQVSKVPGSDGFVFPNWSPNGRHLSAITGDRKRVMLFDFTTRKWTELAKGSVPEPFLYHPVWSRDGKDVYFSGHAEAGSPIYRVRISDRKLERVVNIGETMMMRSLTNLLMLKK